MQALYDTQWGVVNTFFFFFFFFFSTIGSQRLVIGGQRCPFGAALLAEVGVLSPMLSFVVR